MHTWAWGRDVTSKKWFFRPHEGEFPPPAHIRMIQCHRDQGFSKLIYGTYYKLMQTLFGFTACTTVLPLVFSHFPGKKAPQVRAHIQKKLLYRIAAEKKTSSSIVTYARGYNALFPARKKRYTITIIFSAIAIFCGKYSAKPN